MRVGDVSTIASSRLDSMTSPLQVRRVRCENAFVPATRREHSRDVTSGETHRSTCASARAARRGLGESHQTTPPRGLPNFGFISSPVRGTQPRMYLFNACEKTRHGLTYQLIGGAWCIRTILRDGCGCRRRSMAHADIEMRRSSLFGIITGRAQYRV